MLEKRQKVEQIIKEMKNRKEGWKLEKQIVLDLYPVRIPERENGENGEGQII